MTEQMFICPLCDSDVNSAKIAQLNLSEDEFVSLQTHIQNGTLKDVIRIYEIAKRWLGDTKNINMELCFKNVERSLTGLPSKISQAFENNIKDLSLKENQDNKDLLKGIGYLKDDLVRYVDLLSASLPPSFGCTAP
jgi:hypothetical protein